MGALLFTSPMDDVLFNFENHDTHHSQCIWTYLSTTLSFIYLKEERDIIWRSSQNDIMGCCFSAHFPSDIRYKNTFNIDGSQANQNSQQLREARLQTHLPRTLSRTSLLEPALSLALIWHSYTPASFIFTFLIIRFQLPRYGICCTWYLSSGM